MGNLLQRLLPRSLRPTLKLYRVQRGALRPILRFLRRYGFTVRAGPFVGLRFPRSTVLQMPSRVPHLAGTFEAELHPVIEAIVKSRPSLLINLGAADGYYAVGMALRLPDTRVTAFEADPVRFRLCSRVARLNETRIDLRGLCTVEALAALDATGATVLCDVDGAEKELIDPEQVGWLRTATLLIEVHEPLAPGVTDELLERLGPHPFPRVDRAAATLSRRPAHRMFWSLGLSPIQQQMILWNCGRYRRHGCGRSRRGSRPVQMRLSSRAEMEEWLRGVEGWFTPGEAWALHESIRNLSPERPITVVEIGSSRGRSTIAAGQALLARTEGGALYAIDPQDDELFGQLQANVDSAGVQSVVNLIRATSREAREEFGSRPVDLVFIDGSHEYEDVRADLRDWLPLVRPGGVVAVNDPFWWGVARALREQLSLREGLRSPRLAHNTLFFSYLPDSSWTRRDGRQLLRVRACFLVARAGGSLLAVTGASRLPEHLKRRVLRTTFRLLIRCFSWLLPKADA